jgi:hypothetical protein
MAGAPSSSIADEKESFDNSIDITNESTFNHSHRLWPIAGHSPPDDRTVHSNLLHGQYLVGQELSVCLQAMLAVLDQEFCDSLNAIDSEFFILKNGEIVVIQGAVN